MFRGYCLAPRDVDAENASGTESRTAGTGGSRACARRDGCCECVCGSSWNCREAALSTAGNHQELAVGACAGGPFHHCCSVDINRADGDRGAADVLQEDVDDLSASRPDRIERVGLELYLRCYLLTTAGCQAPREAVYVYVDNDSCRDRDGYEQERGDDRRDRLARGYLHDEINPARGL